MHRSLERIPSETQIQIRKEAAGAGACYPKIPGSVFFGQIIKLAEIVIDKAIGRGEP
jgi:hypothetical protein